MLGFADGWVTAVYLLCIASTVLCVGYGLAKWNEEEVMPEPVHPAGEDLSFEDEV